MPDRSAQRRALPAVLAAVLLAALALRLARRRRHAARHTWSPRRRLLLSGPTWARPPLPAGGREGGRRAGPGRRLVLLRRRPAQPSPAPRL